MLYSRSLFLIAFFLIFSLPVFSDAQIFCRSSAGGHCVNLAAAAAAPSTLPGLEFLGKIATPNDLFSKIYTFGVSFVGLAAFFMFTYGAIRYMTAGEGSPSEAKKIMYNAIFGLVLALVSYLILNIINPDLVRGFNINLPKIEGLTDTSKTPTPAGTLPEKGRPSELIYTVTSPSSCTSLGGKAYSPCKDYCLATPGLCSAGTVCCGTNP